MKRRRDLFLAIATLALAAAALPSDGAEKLDARVELASNADRQEWIARVEGGARAYLAFAEQAYETFQDEARQRRAERASPKSQGSYLSDPTLRRHDVFVTATGFHVFKGSTHFPYLESDFVHLSEAEGKALFLSLAARP